MLRSIHLVAAVLYRNNLHRKKTNILLNSQKHELENALIQLKSTQSPTHPIRKNGFTRRTYRRHTHEIQNPLNFVNNFSEVEHELVDEMKSK